MEGKAVTSPVKVNPQTVKVHLKPCSQGKGWYCGDNSPGVSAWWIHGSDPDSPRHVWGWCHLFCSLCHISGFWYPFPSLSQFTLLFGEHILYPS